MRAPPFVEKVATWMSEHSAWWIFLWRVVVLVLPLLPDPGPRKDGGQKRLPKGSCDDR